MTTDDDDDEAHPHIYAIYQGNSKLWCKGRCITGDHYNALIFTWGAIVITSALFFVFSSPFLWHKVSPVVVIIAAYLLFLVVANLLWAGLTDPGTPDSSNYIRPQARNVTVMGKMLELRYCHTCHQFRHPRSTHCSVTDNCIDTFDHFCPCVYHLVDIIRGSGVGGLRKHAGVIVVLIVAFFTFFPVIGLVTFHLDLVSRAITTNESFKMRFPYDRSPFTRGSTRSNFLYYLLGPRRPPLMRWREKAMLYDLKVWEERVRDPSQHQRVISRLERVDVVPIYRNNMYTGSSSVNLNANNRSQSSSSLNNHAESGYAVADPIKEEFTDRGLIPGTSHTLDVDHQGKSTPLPTTNSDDADSKSSEYLIITGAENERSPRQLQAFTV